VPPMQVLPPGPPPLVTALPPAPPPLEVTAPEQPPALEILPEDHSSEALSSVRMSHLLGACAVKQDDAVSTAKKKIAHTIAGLWTMKHLDPRGFADHGQSIVHRMVQNYVSLHDLESRLPLLGNASSDCDLLLKEGSMMTVLDVWYFTELPNGFGVKPVRPSQAWLDCAMKVARERKQIQAGVDGSDTVWRFTFATELAEALTSLRDKQVGTSGPGIAAGSGTATGPGVPGGKNSGITPPPMARSPSLHAPNPTRMEAGSETGAAVRSLSSAEARAAAKVRQQRAEATEVHNITAEDTKVGIAKVQHPQVHNVRADEAKHPRGAARATAAAGVQSAPPYNWEQTAREDGGYGGGGTAIHYVDEPVDHNMKGAPAPVPALPVAAATTHRRVVPATTSAGPTPGRGGSAKDVVGRIASEEAAERHKVRSAVGQEAAATAARKAAAGAAKKASLLAASEGRFVVDLAGLVADTASAHAATDNRFIQNEVQCESDAALCSSYLIQRALFITRLFQVRPKSKDFALVSSIGRALLRHTIPYLKSQKLKGALAPNDIEITSLVLMVLQHIVFPVTVPTIEDRRAFGEAAELLRGAPTPAPDAVDDVACHSSIMYFAATDMLASAEAVGADVLVRRRPSAQSIPPLEH